MLPAPTLPASSLKQWQIKGGRTVENGGRTYKTGSGTTLEQCAERCLKTHDHARYDGWADKDGDECEWYIKNKPARDCAATTRPSMAISRASRRQKRASTACWTSPWCSTRTGPEAGRAAPTSRAISRPMRGTILLTTRRKAIAGGLTNSTYRISTPTTGTRISTSRHALTSPMCVFRDKGVHDESPTHIPSVASCDVAGLQTEALLARCCARWPGQGSFAVDEKHLNKDDGFPTFPVVLTLNQGAWDESQATCTPSTRSESRATGSTSVRSSWR